MRLGLKNFIVLKDILLNLVAEWVKAQLRIRQRVAIIFFPPKVISTQEILKLIISIVMKSQSCGGTVGSAIT